MDDMGYGEYTKVPFDRTVSEIQSMLRKRGAGQIFYGEDGDRFAIQFSLADRMIRFQLSLSDTPGKPATEQRRKQRARALMMVIKAKLESVDAEIETIEEAFLANVVMSDGKTVYERVSEPMALEYQSGRPSATAGLLEAPK
jgi:hypothetical protein